MAWNGKIKALQREAACVWLWHIVLCIAYHVRLQVAGYTNGTASVNAFSGTGVTNNPHSKPPPAHSTGSHGAFSSLQKSAATPSSLQPTSAPSSGQNTHQYTIINNSATSGVVATAPSNRTKSPYARPLSAKEVE